MILAIKRFLVSEIPVEALYVGQVDDLEGPERLSKSPGRGVGVEVVCIPVFASRQWGNHRYVPLTLEAENQARGSPR